MVKHSAFHNTAIVTISQHNVKESAVTSSISVFVEHVNVAKKMECYSELCSPY